MRSTMKPYDFKWTKFYLTNTDFPYDELQIELAKNERFICSTVIDKDNFSILTTRQLFTKYHGRLSAEKIYEAKDKFYGDFKANQNNGITFGAILLQNGKEFKYFVETGKASMIMIHGVRTLIRITQMTDLQVEKVTRIWNKQNES